MAADEEKLVERQESEAKLSKSSSESLERNRSAEKSKAEQKRDEADLARKGEAAERKIKAELEKKESDLARKQEKSKEAEEKKSEKAKEVEKKPKTPLTKAEQKRVYKKELGKIQTQLPAGSRAFSKVVHNPVVETVSNAAEKTILRPSVLIGGAVVGIGMGLVVYFAARVYGYPLPNWLLLVLLILGGVLGVLIELILKLAGKTRK
jgi:hypothetical protein